MEIPPEALETDDSIMLSDLIKDEFVKSKEPEAWTFADLHILAGTSCVPFWIILSNITAQPVCEER
jgi:hypothetical protein